MIDTKSTATNTRAETPQAWVGCDVAKATFDAALWTRPETGRPRELKELPVRSFERSPAGVRACVEWVAARLGHGDFRVVMEATGKYSTELAAWMIALRPALAPAIVNPETARRFAQSLALGNKTDRGDARALARYGAERLPVAFEPPSAERAELRDLTRHRLAVIETRVAEENRAKEPSASPLVRKLLARHVAQLRRDEARLETAMAKCIAANAELDRDARLLTGIHGVGFVTAASVLAELGDLRRFPRARQLVAFAGVNPRHERSGSSVRRPGRLSKRGSSRVRRTLYMAALSVTRGNSELADFYRHLIETGKTKMSALGALMRKLLVVMRAVVISGRPYEKHFRAAVHNQ